MKRILILLVAVIGLAVIMYQQGYLTPGQSVADNRQAAQSLPKAGQQKDEPATAVSVVTARVGRLQESVLVTGTLVARQEIIISPEIEGLRVVELLAEEGDRVTKGQILARLEQETLKLQLAQNDATLAKSAAAIAQAKSNIISAEARRVEATNALDRAKPLKQTGVVSESTLDQRESAARTAVASLAVARDGLLVSEAELAQIQAQRRDIDWRLSRTEIRAPVAGLISRRSAKTGAVATGASIAEPMFRMIADAQIELEADVPETDLSRLKAGQTATIVVAGSGNVTGKIRLVSPEVDKATRQGKVRIGLGDDSALRIGSFGRGAVATRGSEGIVVPASALLYGPDGAFVQVVVAGRVETRKVMTGLAAGDAVELRSGVAAGDTVVAKSGTFLRAGDRVNPILAPDPQIKLN